MSEGDMGLDKFIESSLADLSRSERRKKLRLNGPFPAKARIVDRGGRSFKIESAVENISAGGLYLHVEQEVEPGATLFVVTEFSGAWTRRARLACVATRGSVLRVEPKPNGGYGVAVAINSHRFLQV